jgi:streptomycin 6-kinase
VPLAVTRADGTKAVLKLQFPGDREAEHEAEALRRWDGDGAVRLLEHEPARHALLLERCEPGTPLADIGRPAALDVLVGRLPRLWKPAGTPFRSLAEEAMAWSAHLAATPERRIRHSARRIVDAAQEALRTLPSSQGEQVLLHQDIHAGNVLRAAREPWLVIDPKPLVGEREFAVAPVVRGAELGHGRREVLYRLDRLTGELGLDRERARLWSLAQTVAWCASQEHVEVATWLLDA